MKFEWTHDAFEELTSGDVLTPGWTDNNVQYLHMIHHVGFLKEHATTLLLSVLCILIQICNGPQIFRKVIKQIVLQYTYTTLTEFERLCPCQVCPFQCFLLAR